MDKKIIWGIVILIVIVGGFFFFQKSDEVVAPEGGEVIPTEPNNGIGDGAEPLDEILEE